MLFILVTHRRAQHASHTTTTPYLALRGLSGPRRERQVLRLRLVVHRRQQLDLVRRRGRARIPASAQHGEGGVGGKEVLLLARDVGLLDEVDVVALALRIDPHLPRIINMAESGLRALQSYRRSTGRSTKC